MSNVSSKPNPTPKNATGTASVSAGKRDTGVTWGPTTAILVTALAMAGAYVVAGLFAYLLPHVFHWSSGQAEKWFNSVAGQFVFVVLAESVIVAVILRYIDVRKSHVRALGFYRKPRLTDLGYVVMLFGLYLIAVTVLTSLAKAFFHIDLDQKQELGFDTVISHADMLLTFVSLVLIPPVVEEFLFRGFLFSGLRTKLPFIWATVITSVLFASLHLAEGANGVLWVAGIDTFILSLFLCYVREKTGNLWAGIFLHACKNAFAFAYLYIFMR